MVNREKLLKYFLFFLSSFLLTACGKENVSENLKNHVIQTASAETMTTSESQATSKVTSKKVSSSTAEEISWDNLVPEGYDPSAIVGKYLDQLQNLQDNDPTAVALYGKIQAELDNAPVNETLNGKTIKMPGFIAPLENKNGIISEFLLVPYFGACIHVPPPPINQTVMIKAGKGQEIKSEDSTLPVWITGTLQTVGEKTNIGSAGYRIENASIEPYQEI